ncbi:MAG: carboxyl transferase [Lachnospiraceae bacterium]|nr:carboxyl transferase [Lachnospiraceae bacterium]
MSDMKNSPAVTHIESLLDENSFVELGALVTARSTDFGLDDCETPSDGVVTGHGLIDGRLVFVFSQDASVLNGTIGEMHAKKILSVYDMAMKMGAPVIGMLDCAGVRLQESVDALESMGEIYAKAVKASGIIPQILTIYRCGGGLSVLPAVSDFNFMVKDGSLFVNSPDTISGNNKDKEDTSSADFQFEAGNVDFVGTEDEVFEEIRNLVMMLPGSNIEGGAIDECEDDLNRASENLLEKRLDPAEFAKEISDGHCFFEARAGYAKEMVTGFIKLNGVTTGVVGNREKCGEEEFETVLSARGCEKATTFVEFCDAFDIPVLTLTNVDGYKSCVCAEKKLARQMGRMVFAFEEASVPKINFITGKAYGTAYILMNSKAIGADLVYAFADAEMGIMPANLAAKILTDDASKFGEVAASFEEVQSGIQNAARRGYIDRVVNPEDARKYLIAGFEMLFTKNVDFYKKHGTK